MKKMTWLLAVVMLVALCAPVMAQTFTDVPTDHWAYQAVQELSQRGLIIGYPDGTFGGRRALTRYEFAMAISRMLPVLREIVREEIGTRPAGGVSESEFNALQRRVTELENRPAGGVTRQDLDNIRRLVDEFRDELATLGVDVDTLKRDVADLRARTSTIEETLRRMPKISAETNFYFRGERTEPGRAQPIDLDGRTLTAQDSILQNVRGLYDVDLRVDGYVSERVRAHALFNAGNYINWLNGHFAGLPAAITANGQNVGLSTPPYIAGFPVSPISAPDTVRPYLLYADTPITASFLTGANLMIGKFPYQLSPYFLRMPDIDSYTYNYKTDSGDYPILGGALNTRIGPAGLSLFAAKQSDGLVPFVGGDGVPMGISQTAGARLNFGVPVIGNLALNYMRSGLNTLSFPAGLGVDQYSWWGVDLNGVLPWWKIGLSTSWAQSQPQRGGSGAPSGFGSRSMLDTRLSVPISAITITGGYRKIDPNFSTPGYWGKIGYLTNPVDIEGPLASINFPIFRKLSFNALGEWYHGLSATYNPGLFPAGIGLTPASIGTEIPNLGGGDMLRHFVAGFRFDLTSTNKVDLGYEEVRYRPAGAEVSRQTFINVGVGHDFNPNTSLKILYQFIDMKNPNVGTQPFWGPRDGQGNVAITQFTVRF